MKSAVLSDSIKSETDVVAWESRKTNAVKCVNQFSFIVDAFLRTASRSALSLQEQIK